MLARREVLTAAGLTMMAWPWARLAAAPVTTSPAGLIFAAISINGRTAKALIDSGSVRGLQLSESFAKTLGLTLADTGQQTQRYQGSGKPVLGARIDALGFGGTTLSGIDASVSPGDIEAIAAQIGEPFDAILGWPLLSRSGFVFDYPANDLTVRDAAGSGLALALAAKPLPVVEGTVADQPVSFLIDTGAPGCRIDVGLASGAAPGSRVDLGFQIGGKSFTASFQVKDLSAMTRGLGARAVIGHRFLNQFRMTWTPASKTIWLAKP
jgi:hypothetical protein